MFCEREKEKDREREREREREGKKERERDMMRKPYPGEYMGHEGRPYCERDYHEKYGVKCAYCQRFISGKVLQAGDNNHFHPTCARCTKCGDPFGDGEEMYLQGAAIWHPRCGPGPGESGFVINGYNGSNVTGNGCDTSSMVDYGLDGLSSTMSELHYGSRASSPGGSVLRDYR